MYIDEKVIETIFTKGDPKVVWPSVDHRAKVMAIILFNYRVDDVETVEKIIAAIVKIPWSDIKNITWFDLQHVYNCPKVW
jgi:hypothetical protein